MKLNCSASELLLLWGSYIFDQLWCLHLVDIVVVVAWSYRWHCISLCNSNNHIIQASRWADGNLSHHSKGYYNYPTNSILMVQKPTTTNPDNTIMWSDPSGGYCNVLINNACMSYYSILYQVFIVTLIMALHGWP